MSSDQAAPHGLDLTMDFVNTVELEKAEEQLTDPVALSGWLADRGLLAAGTSLRQADLSAAIELREALRQAMLANNGEAPPGDWVAHLEAVASAGELGVRFGADGARIAPRGEGLPGALAGLLVPVAEAMADGSWGRVKACRAHDCHWAFYDRSRNGSGTWCEMAVCGNREKVRAYRERRQTQS